MIKDYLSNNIFQVGLKVDLAKAYDKVNWLYLRFILINEFLVLFLFSGSISLIFSQWLGYTYFQLRPKSSTRFLLSAPLFLVATEGLSRLLKQSKRCGNFKDIKIWDACCLNHLWFVDDTLIFFVRDQINITKLKNINKLFCLYTNMKIGLKKPTISFFGF